MEEGILFNSAFVAEYQFYPNFVKKIFYSLKFLYFSSLYLISIKCKEIISIIFVETSFVNFIWMVWVGWVFLFFFLVFFLVFFSFLEGVAAVNCPSFLCVFFFLMMFIWLTSLRHSCYSIRKLQCQGKKIHITRNFPGSLLR